MNENSHRRRQVVDSVERPLLESAEVPQARVDLLHGFRDVPLVRVVGVGVVQARAAESRQVLVVGAGAKTDRLGLGKAALQFRQRRRHPVRHRALTDLAPEFLQPLLSLVGVGRELGFLDHRRCLGVEIVEAHEFVVETERHGEAFRNRSARKAERAQSRDIRGLDTDAHGLLESDLAQRADAPDGKVPGRRLRIGRTQVPEVALDLLNRRLADLVPVGFDGVMDVLPDQGGDRRILTDAANVSVWNSVLNRTQIDV